MDEHRRYVATEARVVSDHESLTVVVRERPTLRRVVLMASIGAIAFGGAVMMLNGLAVLTSPVVLVIALVPILVGAAGLWTGGKTIPSVAMGAVALLGGLCALILAGLSLLVSGPLGWVQTFGALCTGLVAAALALRTRVDLRTVTVTTRDLTVEHGGRTWSAPLEAIEDLRPGRGRIELEVSGQRVKRFGRSLDSETRAQLLLRIREARERRLTSMTEEQAPPKALIELVQRQSEGS